MSRSRVSLVGLGLGLGLGLASLACKPDTAETKGQAEAGAQPETSAIPTTAEGFLAELVPLPEGEAIEVHYEITGPAVRGQMSILVAEGGRRRDRWELRSTVTEMDLRTSGETIVNPDHVWVAHDSAAGDGAAGELETNHLVGLADAYLDLDPDARARVVESVRRWHELLASQREQSGGDRIQILGVTCLRTRVAAQNVCMWEETGLLLRYEGSAFTLEATRIDRSPELPPGAFDLPPAARAQAPKPAEAQDYAKIMADIAAGSYGQVSVLVLASKGVPSLSLPAPG